MHELSITRNVVAICAERAHGARVARVTLQIGKLSGVLPEAVRFCFDICAADTVVAGARLEIDEPGGIGRCRDCAAEVAMDALFARCACGSSNLQLVGGDELKIKEMEVA